METNVTLTEDVRLLEHGAEDRFKSLGLRQQDIDHIVQTTKSLDYMYTASTERAKAASANPAYILENGNVILPFWLDPNMRPGGGACYDASENLRFTWFFDGTFDNLHDKGLDLFVCGGSDGKVFVGEGFNHVFLVVAKHGKKPKEFAPHDAIVIDPSLQKIAPLDKSGYNISKVFDEDTVFTNELNHKIVPYDLDNLNKPSYTITNESTAVLGMDPKRNYVFYMIMLHDKEKKIYYPSLGVSKGNKAAIYYKPQGAASLKSIGSLAYDYDSFDTINLVQDMASEICKIGVQPALKKDGYEVDKTGMRLVDMPFIRKVK